MLRGCVYMEGSVLKLSQELDEAINEYMQNNNISTLEDVERKRDRLHKAIIGPKLKQDEIDQLIKDMEG